jgi:putative salt-induced outer membrane protein YdiY
MKNMLMLALLVASASSFAENKIDTQEKASDFFKNPSASRNLIKLLNTTVSDDWSDTDEQGPSFDLDGEFGALVTTGNTSTRMLKLALDSKQELQSWSNQYFLQVLRRKTELDDDDVQVLETNRIQVSAQFDYKLTHPNNRLFGYAEYDDNQFLRVRDQFTAVVGWSQLAWKKRHTEFRYSIGPGYTRSEQDDTGLKVREAIIRTTADYQYRFKNDARFRQTLSAEMGEVNTRARSKTSVSAKIFERLAMKFSFEMAVDENVSQEVDTFTTQTSISMVYQFF